MNVDSTFSANSVVETSLWRHEDQKLTPRLRLDGECGFDPQFLEYLLAKVPKRPATCYEAVKRLDRRDVDSARCRNGMKTPRRYEDWRRLKQEINQRLESELHNLQEQVRSLNKKNEAIEAENEQLSAQIARLEVEKADTRHRFLELESERTKREEKRKQQVQTLQKELRQVLEETVQLREKLSNSERKFSTVTLLYENDAEKVAKLSFENERLRETLIACKEELMSWKSRSDAWEEAVVSLKQERDEAEQKHGNDHSGIESVEQNLRVLVGKPHSAALIHDLHYCLLIDEKTTLEQSLQKELDLKLSEIDKTTELASKKMELATTLCPNCRNSSL